MSKNYYQMSSAAAAQLEIDYLRDQLNQAKQRLNDVFVARQILKSHGYYADRLWHVDDVLENYHCDKELAYKILGGALDSVNTTFTIYEAIDDIASDLELEKNKSDYGK